MFRDRILNRIRPLALISHALIITAAFYTAWLLRFDFSIVPKEQEILVRAAWIVVPIKLMVRFFLGLLREHWWRHRSLIDLLRLFRNNLISSSVAGIAVFAVIGPAYPRSIYLLDFLVTFLLSGSLLFGVRIYRELIAIFNPPPEQKRLLVYGAGVAGIALAREIRENPKLGYRVVGFIDDDHRKQGATVMGLRVLGSGKEIQNVVDLFQAREQEIHEIAVAMPSATGAQIRGALSRAQQTNIPSRIVPGLGELISGKLSLARMREISVTDILGRDPVELDLACVRRTVQGQSVLVTGAAGSIGTELCHQIAALEPAMLVAFDQAESELFRLEADLKAKFPNLCLIAEVGDIRESRHVEFAIEEYRVGCIFHAAAYKHVPLMERQVCEAVRNNVIGTWNLTQAAWRANVRNFVLISTDKAVNPTSIMGLTKRVTELIVASRRAPVGRGPQTKFVAVRFGNVLVSNGSVVPTFQKQIAAGGPVSVTHRDMCRYFMTVREAVQLVLQASSMGSGSEIFVLDMGTPVKIVDLAEKMITLAGFTPGRDIEIAFTGLRPGEKLFEEISIHDEHVVDTEHSKIKIFKSRQHSFAEIAGWIMELQHLLYRRDAGSVIEHMRLIVPEYRPSEAFGTASTAATAASARPAPRPATQRMPQKVQAAAAS
ncbi:MAG TPA: nucleoside-diphosphate sugar epimerase/dehydratase [Bryobacteraceae bacterium]|jgi:FlaA1/EpsC-like NDP-sugar epimerase|nr:nucleoside-diphosphate sugar epimerase/dehydratase [Bryobacteraceae bacterium]